MSLLSCIIWSAFISVNTVALVLRLVLLKSYFLSSPAFFYIRPSPFVSHLFLPYPAEIWLYWQNFPNPIWGDYTCPLTLVFLELSHLLGLSVTHSGRLRECVRTRVFARVLQLLVRHYYELAGGADTLPNEFIRFVWLRLTHTNPTFKSGRVKQVGDSWRDNLLCTDPSCVLSKNFFIDDATFSTSQSNPWQCTCVRVCWGNCCSVTRCGRLVILLLYLRVPDNKSQPTSARDAHTPSTLCLEHTEQTQ